MAPLSIPKLLSVLSLAVLEFTSTTNAQRFVNETAFPTTEEFYQHVSTLGLLGLRTPGSPRHYAFVQYVEKTLKNIPGLNLTYNSFDLYNWSPKRDMTVHDAGHLSIKRENGTCELVKIGGALGYSTPLAPATGELVFIDRSVTNFTGWTNLTDKVVMRDYNVQGTSIAYGLVEFTGIYETADIEEVVNTIYERPYLNDGQGISDVLMAQAAGAVGYVQAWDVPQKNIQSNWPSSEGTHYRMPAVAIGSDETAQLKKLVAGAGISVTVAVEADAKVVLAKEIFATLPGLTTEKIYIVCHTDGVTWVQDNGVSALLTMAKYFAAQPLSTRNKTLVFAFTAGHLQLTREGDFMLAQQLDKTYDHDDTAFVIPMEHMGTREILARNRTDGGPGRELYFSGKGEVMLWAVGPVQKARDAAIAAAKHRNLDRVIIARGLSAPNDSVVPEYTSFGGLGTYFNDYLLPTASIISGPWSLFAPSWGESAINFTRLRDQTLAFADLVYSLDPYSKAELAGNYTIYREKRAEGFPTFLGNDSFSNSLDPPEFAPGYFGPSF